MQFEPQFKTKEEMVEFLCRGGIDVDNFDKISAKTLQNLFDECRDLEVRLEFEDGRVYRKASTVRVLIYAGQDRRYFLRELYRVYKRTGEVVVKNPYASLTGTCKRGETLLGTVVREVNQECERHGVLITTRQVHLVPAGELNDPAFGYGERLLPKVEERPSTAYAGLWTISYNSWCRIKFPTRPWTASPTMLDDGDVESCVKWEDSLRGLKKLPPALKRSVRKLKQSAL